MKPKTLTICRIAVMASLVLLLPWLITDGNPFLPVAVVLVGMALTVLLKRNDKRTLVDERIRLIHGKTATLSLNFFLIISTVVGLILITLSYNGYSGLSAMGYTLLYSNCALLVLNLIIGAYFRRQYGG